MAREKIPLNPEQKGLNAAFASLNLSGLPDGPSEEARIEPDAIKRKPGRVVLRRETAHRGGKTVIVVDDFAPHITKGEIERLLSKVRAACGCGGTMRERNFEVQSNQPARIRELLEKEGFTVAGER